VLQDLNNGNGFYIEGENGNYTIRDVSPIGDVNGDGMSDLLVEIGNVKFVYVVYGVLGRRTDKIMQTNPASLAVFGSGFIISFPVSYGSTISASSVGDWNGDGVGDFAIGFPNSDRRSGMVYVVFGSAGGRNGIVDLDSFSEDDGILISAVQGSQALFGAYINSGCNSMGINTSLSPWCPVVIGDMKALYVFKSPVRHGFSMSLFNETNGIMITGSQLSSSRFSNMKLAFIGDVNNDGIVDFAMGSPFFNQNNGQMYIVFGTTIDAMENIYLDDLQYASNNRGLSLTHSPLSSGVSVGFGCSISGAGDVNSDGVDDFIVGSLFGGAYILYGSSVIGELGMIDVTGMTLSQGFHLHHGLTRAFTGFSVAGSFDLNKDGLSDIAIGSPYGVSGNYIHVIYGRQSSSIMPDIDITTMTRVQGLCFATSNYNDRTGFIVKAIGDVDNDGFKDLLIVSTKATNTAGISVGVAYVVTDIYGTSTYHPTQAPNSLTVKPTKRPSVRPSVAPTSRPSLCPSSCPSQMPSSSFPTGVPSWDESDDSGMSQRPTSPTLPPSCQPSKRPTCTPSNSPTIFPTRKPSRAPTLVPSVQPSYDPTEYPTAIEPSYLPSSSISVLPSLAPINDASNSTLLNIDESSLALSNGVLWGTTFSALSAMVILGLGVIRCYAKRNKKSILVVPETKLRCNGSRDEIYQYFIHAKHIKETDCQDDVTLNLFIDIAENSATITRNIYVNLVSNCEHFNVVTYFMLCGYLSDGNSELRDAAFTSLRYGTPLINSRIIVPETMYALSLLIGHLFDDTRLYAIGIIELIARHHPSTITQDVNQRIKCQMKDSNVNISTAANVALKAIHDYCVHLHDTQVTRAKKFQEVMPLGEITPSNFVLQSMYNSSLQDDSNDYSNSDSVISHENYEPQYSSDSSLEWISPAVLTDNRSIDIEQNNINESEFFVQYTSSEEEDD
jgi:hypothetical protein